MWGRLESFAAEHEANQARFSRSLVPGSLQRRLSLLGAW